MMLRIKWLSRSSKLKGVMPSAEKMMPTTIDSSTRRISVPATLSPKNCRLSMFQPPFAGLGFSPRCRDFAEPSRVEAAGLTNAERADYASHLVSDRALARCAALRQQKRPAAAPVEKRGLLPAALGAGLILPIHQCALLRNMVEAARPAATAIITVMRP